MPNKHGVGKSNTVVERDPKIDDPFIQRFKLREGWKIIYKYLLAGQMIRFTIDGIRYTVYKDLDLIKLQNQKTGKRKEFKLSDIETVCQVIITSDKWDVLL